MAEPSAAATQVPAARGPFAARLALKLVGEALGSKCEQVVKCLIDHGVQQYGDLVRHSGLPPGQLRAALLMLVQHNYVNCYLKQEPPTLRGPGPEYTLYEVALSRILQILRVPRFLTHIADEHGQDSVRLMYLLLEHGRLRWGQLLDAVMAEAAEEEGEEAAPSADVLANKFRSLVIERYVERVPPCNLPPPAQQVHPNARKKKAAPKPGSEEEADMHREQAEAAQRQLYQEVRFQLLDDLSGGGGSGAAAAVDKQDKPASKRKRGRDAAAEEPAKKKGRKKGGGDDAGGAAAAAASPRAAGAAQGEGEPVLWRVNFDEFNRRFRNEVVASTIKLRYGIPAGQAVMGLLMANARFEHASRTSETVVLSVGDARSVLMRAHGHEEVPEDMQQVLRELSEDELKFLDPRGSGPGGEQYVMHLPLVLNMARLLDMQAVIRNKFGPHGVRIWRLLLINGQLEQKQVADLAMITKEEAREKLYAMLKSGYLGLQDVPRTADHAPSRTFYTWRANMDAGIARVASDLYRAAGNLHARLTHELTKQQELVDLLEDGHVAGHVLERRRDEIQMLRAVNTRLEASLMDLDFQICKFCDV
ncbi:DNA-directed RNA polymerase III subunit RPC3 [Micractinium conductrix]|uniref:DNA-directed RNA polymerase III subunit RPC3 n=1 Tax=Micractinium conductrix TaxID=554055 RepID=A0A2P6VH43_9CHLO|nr:DNA-directed RNA polymerase III subunit RPC3 [Micractinium conductrix]|eukprot:PSC73409.1 DNA-directed RNA polymerase III subunit RPC3 [Micractinium conductrix]